MTSGVVAVHLAGRLGEQRVGPERALGHRRACSTPPRVSTAASGGVNVPSVANVERAGNRPPAADERMARRQVGVDARERAEAMGGAQILDCGRLGDVARCDTGTAAACCRNRRSFTSGPPDLEPRRRTPTMPDHAQRLAALGPERRIEVVEPRLPRDRRRAASGSARGPTRTARTRPRTDSAAPSPNRSHRRAARPA